MTDCFEQQMDTFEFSQPAGGSYPRDIDVSGRSALRWKKNLPVSPGMVISPPRGYETGLIYQSAAYGQTGLLPPAFPTVAGGTVLDGSANWTAVVPPAAGQDQIASVTWSQVNPPDGTLTITDTSNTGFVASANIGGGTSGNVYTVKVTITMTSTAIYVVTIYVTIV